MLLKDHEFYLTGMISIVCSLLKPMTNWLVGSWNTLYLNDSSAKPDREVDEDVRTEVIARFCRKDSLMWA
jgi:hypothetical protein